MNKLGLASLDGLELSDAATTAGFWKPPEMLIAARTYRPICRPIPASPPPAGFVSEWTSARGKSTAASV